MVKWQHRDVRDLRAYWHLGSLGLNDAGDIVDDFIPTGVQGSEGIWKSVVDRIRPTIGDSTVEVLLPRKIGIVAAEPEVVKELKTKFRNRSCRPPPSAAAHPPRAIVRARHRDDRDMDAHVARPGGDDGRKLLRNASAGSAVPCAASGDHWSPPRVGCRAPLRRSTRPLRAMLRRWLADARC
ncbi:hypothetical protein F511_36665 [Dorcoceras hygrometricum]|uniref:Uncharacterized protein n=1 Tax=Dorcoceras hygrometricum TaxID=472368 RepID=A0A2Z7AWT8_9LAMI|nr:hypothetical protein F511_36665 [Dorcoceras hygrometricum]